MSGFRFFGSSCRQRFKDNHRTGTRQLYDLLCRFEDGYLLRVSEVYRPGEVIRRLHQPDQPVHHVVDIAERTGLGPVPVDRDRLSSQGLEDEVRDDPAVIRVHARAVGVEDPGHLDLQAVLAVIIEEEGLRAPFPLVVTGPWTDGVDASEVGLGLGVDGRISIDLRSGGLEDLGLEPLGQAEHVDRAVDIDLRRLDRVVLVVDRGRRTGQVVDLVCFDVQRER